MRKGFTLIELLVVVLIIGILAAVVLPQYQRAVEKARMAEAVINVRAIANAQQLFYLQNGRYAEATEMDALDVQIPGEQISQGAYTGRINTNYFVYSPSDAYGIHIALAKRFPIDESYYIAIEPTNLARIVCHYNSQATNIQQKLCAELNEKGSL